MYASPRLDDCVPRARGRREDEEDNTFLFVAEAEPRHGQQRWTRALVDHAVSGTPAAGGPSRLGAIKKRGAAIASMLGANRPVYTTLLENLRAA